jgi:hypothetical protein
MIFHKTTEKAPPKKTISTTPIAENSGRLLANRTAIKPTKGKIRDSTITAVNNISTGRGSVRISTCRRGVGMLWWIFDLI